MTATQNREDIVTTAETRPILTRRERAVYRTSTGLVLAVMLFSIVNFVFNDHFPFPNGPEGAFVHLGFPPYFKVELTVTKILGVLALVIPAVPLLVDSLVFFCLLAASYYYFEKSHSLQADARAGAMSDHRSAA